MYTTQNCTYKYRIGSSHFLVLIFTFAFPVPPGHARTFSVSAYSFMGLNPSLKYGPTGLKMANKRT